MFQLCVLAMVMLFTIAMTLLLIKAFSTPVKKAALPIVQLPFVTEELTQEFCGIVAEEYYESQTFQIIQKKILG